MGTVIEHILKIYPWDFFLCANHKETGEKSPHIMLSGLESVEMPLFKKGQYEV